MPEQEQDEGSGKKKALVAAGAAGVAAPLVPVAPVGAPKTKHADRIARSAAKRGKSRTSHVRSAAVGDGFRFGNEGYTARLAQQIRDKGFDESKPIKLSRYKDGNLVVTDGHHRLRAAEMLGMKRVPTVVEDVDQAKYQRRVPLIGRKAHERSVERARKPQQKFDDATLDRKAKSTPGALGEAYNKFNSAAERAGMRASKVLRQRPGVGRTAVKVGVGGAAVGAGVATAHAIGSAGKKKKDDVEKSYIPGVGYVPAVKAGKKRLRHAAKMRKAPYADRPGPTAMDRQDKESISQVAGLMSEHVGGAKKKLTDPAGKFGAKPLADKANNKEIEGRIRGRKGDVRTARRGVKAIEGKRGLKTAYLSPSGGPVEQAMQLGQPFTAAGARTISAGPTGFKEGGKQNHRMRRRFHRGARKQTDEAGGMHRAVSDTHRAAYGRQSWSGTGMSGSLTRILERTNPRMGRPGSQPGGRDAPGKKPRKKTTRDLGVHEAGHLEMGSSKLRRKLAAGHITQRDFDLALAARKARHDAKNPTGPKYGTKEEARVDARTRQVSGGDEDGRRWVSGHDAEDGYVSSFNEIKRGMNRTEKRRRKKGLRRKHHMVDEILTHDQIRSGKKPRVAKALSPIKALKKRKSVKMDAAYGPKTSSGLMGQAGSKKINRNIKPFGV